MKSAKKALLIVVCVAMIVAASVFGTLAYLTDSAMNKNTFTVGKVGISLTESKVNELGEVVANADPVTGNAYKLMPGHTYTKDPTITVNSDSENCWLFVKVENGIAALEDADKSIESQMTAKGWVKMAEGYYAYNTQVSKNAEVQVFKSFTIADKVADLSGYTDATVTITAYAIQATGFTTYSEAWTAISGQLNLK